MNCQQVVNTGEDVENAKPLAAKLRAKIVLPLKNAKKESCDPILGLRAESAIVAS